LKCDIKYTEEFPATINNNECVKIIRESAQQLKMQVQNLEVPFRWSEDFGHFTQLTKAAQFGIGSGINHPQLHNEDYDFPDELIDPSINVFMGILDNILK
jgi:metal-dependent amidase/aminoacylase/carboxypeptidase family protein